MGVDAILRGLDARSLAARDFKKQYDELILRKGGVDACDETMKSIIRNIAGLRVVCDMHIVRALTNDPNYDGDLHVRQNSQLSRYLRLFGWEDKEQKEFDPDEKSSELHDYMRKTFGEEAVAE